MQQGRMHRGAPFQQAQRLRSGKGSGWRPAAEVRRFAEDAVALVLVASSRQVKPPQVREREQSGDAPASARSQGSEAAC